MTRSYDTKNWNGMIKQEKGYTLVEVITALVLVGVIGVFSSIFLVSAVKGYLFTKEASNSAFNAQISMNRIGLELRAINSMPQFTANTSITYTSDDLDLPGTRKIIFDSGNIYINVDGTDYKLLDNISNPVLAVTSYDFYSDGSDEVAYIDVGFTLKDTPAFSVRIYPRNMVAAP